MKSRRSRSNLISAIKDAYKKHQQPLAIGILLLAAGYSAFGYTAIALPALATVALIVIQVLFAIESHISMQDSSNTFNDFSDASREMMDLVFMAATRSNLVTLSWIGSTMDRGGPFLINSLRAVFRERPNVKIRLEIFMLNPDSQYLRLHNANWPQQAKLYHDQLQSWLSEIDPNRLEGTITTFDVPPSYTGLLIDNNVLFMAFCHWEDCSGINYTQEYSVGNNPYFKRIRGTSEKSDEHIRQYLGWVAHYKRAPQLR
jgi:hypothetical protein